MGAWLKKWWMPLAVLFEAALIAVLFSLLIPSLKQTTTNAQRGNEAKARQCFVAPISVKLYNDAFRRGVISSTDLALTYKTAPTGC